MKYFLGIFTFIICSIGLQAQGIEFFHGNWAEALEKAKSEDRIIFVDAYTTWCGPCKKMSANVFPDEKVGDFYNSNFLNVKIDMEKGEGRTFRSTYKVSGFPTLLYVDGEGKLVHKEVGAREADALIKLGKKALAKVDYTSKYSTAYEAGDRSFDLMYNYVKALNKAKKPSLKVSNEYLRTQKNLKTEENLKFILEAAVEVDSRSFGLLEDHKSAIIKQEGKEKVQDRISLAASNTVRKAIVYKSEDLLKEAQSKMKKHLPAKAKAFAHTSQIEYYAGLGEAEQYLKAAKKYSSSIISNDALMLDKLAMQTMAKFRKETALMKLAEDLSSKAVKLNAKSQFLLNYTRILYVNGDKEKALTMIDKAIAKAKEEGMKNTLKLDRFKQMIQKS